MKKLTIIAEAGVNHNGNISYAKKLIIYAKKSGADYIKFQTFKADNMVKKNTALVNYQKSKNFLKSQYELLKRLELSEKQHEVIVNFCKKKKIKFLSTPFDIESCILLKKLGLKIIKISSGEIDNYPLLLEISKFAKKVIISTGMSTLLDIKKAIKILKKNLKDKDITVLHCTTSYPTYSNEANILAISFLKKKFKNNIGYSDHTLGKNAAIAAVALGATVIEKHITLNKKLSGPDHKASLEPNEFLDFVRSLRNIQEILGIENKILTKTEKINKLLIRKSIVAKKNIKKGDKFTINNITTKRPQGGLSPMYWTKVIGKKSLKNFNYDDFIFLK